MADVGSQLLRWTTYYCHAHGIVTTSVHKTLPRGGGDEGGDGAGGLQEVKKMAWFLLSIKWNSIGLGGHAHGIVTKTVHKTLHPLWQN